MTKPIDFFAWEPGLRLLTPDASVQWLVFESGVEAGAFDGWGRDYRRVPNREDAHFRVRQWAALVLGATPNLYDGGRAVVRLQGDEELLCSFITVAHLAGLDTAPVATFVREMVCAR